MALDSSDETNNNQHYCGCEEAIEERPTPILFLKGREQKIGQYTTAYCQ